MVNKHFDVLLCDKHTVQTLASCSGEIPVIRFACGRSEVEKWHRGSGRSRWERKTTAAAHRIKSVHSSSHYTTGKTQWKMGWPSNWLMMWFACKCFQHWICISIFHGCLVFSVIGIYECWCPCNTIWRAKPTLGGSVSYHKQCYGIRLSGQENTE